MDSAVFWSSSLQEVFDFIESRKRVQKQKKKEEILNIFLLANLIAERDPLTDKTGKELTMPWDYYPELFVEEERQYTLAKEEAEFEVYKEKRRLHAREFNTRRHLGEGGE